MTKRILVITLLFSIIMLCFMGGCGQDSKIKSAADEFMALMLEGRHVEAQEKLSPEGAEVIRSLGGIRDRNLKWSWKSENMAKYEITDVDIGENRSRVFVQITTNEGTTYDGSIDLVRVGREWMVEWFD